MKEFNKVKAAVTRPEITAKFTSHNWYELNFKREAQFLLVHLVKMKIIDKVQIEDLDQVLIDTAIAGITLDPTLNFAYVSVRKINNRLAIMYDVGYQGMISKLKLLSDIQDVFAHVVFDNDRFEGSQGVAPDLQHTPYYFLKKTRKERGTPWGAYAVIVFKGGYRKFDFLPVERIEEIRNLSSDYKMDKKNGTNFSAWNNEHWEEMWMKTAIKHIYKTIPKKHFGSDLAAAEEITKSFTQDNEAQGMHIDTPTAVTEVVKDKMKAAAEQAIKKGKVEKKVEEKALTRKELSEIYKRSNGKKQLELYANKLGILEIIIKNHTGKRLSKKVVYEAILKHYDNKEVAHKNNGTAPAVKEKGNSLLQTIERLKKEYQKPGLGSFVKVSSRIITLLDCPTKDPQKLRSVNGCSALYGLIQHYDAEEELKKKLGKDPYAYIAKASNDELGSTLLSL